MDKITIGSVAIRKILEKALVKCLRKKIPSLSIIFTAPLDMQYNDETGLIDADIQIHVRLKQHDLENLLD